MTFADPIKLPKGAVMVPPAEYTYPTEESILELLAVCIWIAIPTVLLFVVPVVVVVLTLIYPLTMIPVLLFYYGYIYVFERDVESRGGWGIVGIGKIFYGLSFWQNYRKYFKSRLVKTADINPNKNYIFCVHPHGVYAMGYFAAVTGNPKVFKSVFPGLDIFAVTLPINFRLPLWREFMLSLGMISCDRKALETVLMPKPKKGESQTGKALILVTGGGEEFLHMTPKTMDLVINKRKGFIKLALTTGSSLVPFIIFGENDLYTRIETPFVKKLNAFTQRVAHFAFPAISGRWGPIPRRVPLATVAGKPFDVEKVENPTQEQIDELQAKYLQELQKLYDEYKDIFFKDRIRDMKFVK
ncbi:Diacylglycerol O-acyltransferase 2 [Phlyctochytrium planicorne]|nr:Diacylglycerol O-acyltransferase 2 [Phlyctochytrium planicorne]